jgi:hypothetical protein
MRRKRKLVLVPINRIIRLSQRLVVRQRLIIPPLSTQHVGQHVDGLEFVEVVGVVVGLAVQEGLAEERLGFGVCLERGLECVGRFDREGGGGGAYIV